MTGIFDSGVGGAVALEHLRNMRPKIDICFFADRANAPYGTKDRGELLGLVCADIERLLLAGAERILMACCTASTVWDILPSEYKSVTVPIIEPTARTACRVTKSGKIGVIATHRTATDKAFTKAIMKIDKMISVEEISAQPLVRMAECGVHDINAVDSVLSPLKNKDIDTLILGCTHFPRLAREISECMPEVSLVSSPYEGAREIAKNTEDTGSAITLYL